MPLFCRAGGPPRSEYRYEQWSLLVYHRCTAECNYICSGTWNHSTTQSTSACVGVKWHVRFCRDHNAHRVGSEVAGIISRDSGSKEAWCLVQTLLSWEKMWLCRVLMSRLFDLGNCRCSVVFSLVVSCGGLNLCRRVSAKPTLAQQPSVNQPVPPPSPFALSVLSWGFVRKNKYF